MVMKDPIDGLAPQRVWEHFRAISGIPRCSRNEQRVRDYVQDVAGRSGLDHQVDGVGKVDVIGGREREIRVELDIAGQEFP